MRLVFISGLSGSGKSVALHMLEDLDYYCIDNIPAALLKSFISHTIRSNDVIYRRTAIGLDARNTAAEIATVPTLIEELKRSGLDCELIYLVSGDEELLRRFAETRRRHPLSRNGESLREAIQIERELLDPIAQAADLTIDTSRIGVHELREMMRQRVERRSSARMSLQFESFGFKHGIPGDADFVFDVRTLPNPYWDTALRGLTGQDSEVAAYLAGYEAVTRVIDDIGRFLEARIPDMRASNRRYLTIAIGCTGGRHRSVYVTEQLARKFALNHPNVSLRHSGLPGTGQTLLADPAASGR